MRGEETRKPSLSFFDEGGGAGLNLFSDSAPMVMFWKREPADSRLSRFGGEHRLVDSFGEYQVNTIHPTLLHKVCIRALVGDDDFRLTHCEDKHEKHKIRINTAVGGGNQGDEAHALDVIGMIVLIHFVLVSGLDDVGLGRSCDTVGVHDCVVKDD